MVSNHPRSLHRILPSEVFDQLGKALQTTVQASGQAGAEEPLLLTEAEVAIPGGRGTAVQRFVLVVSHRFSGLLLAKRPPGVLRESHNGKTDPAAQQPTYEVEWVFDPTAIATFITDLITRLRADLGRTRKQHPDLSHRLEQALQQLHPNDAELQSEFTLQLTEALMPAPGETVTETSGAGCDRVVAAALQQQAEQEQLLNQVATQIRQSMDLSTILQTAVQQVLHLVQADRVVIYQLTCSPSPPVPAYLKQIHSTQSTRELQGRITYEARAQDTLPSILDLVEEAYCFVDVPDYREKYRKGHLLAVDDVEIAFQRSPCLLQLLQRARVRAKLIAPIVVQEDLWGLLIAHQCNEPRVWQTGEKTFLQCIAEYLSIAIHQTQLYAQVQQQAQTLEQRVIERTQELQDALKAAQSANLAKTEFLSAMSHELRTPLTCIIGMATTLLRLLTGSNRERFLSVERQQDYLRTIQTSGEHLLQLINDILDLSEVEAGRMILDVQPFSLIQLASESLQLLKDNADEKAVQLSLDIRLEPHGEGVVFASDDQFIADPYRVKQILLNLLSNAIKFTPSGGQVILRTWRENTLLALQVEDTGIGIPEAQRSLLFNKFQQLDMSHQRIYEGIGLGLALTKQLVELHRGWIDVESTVGVGSTFTVWLPEQSLDVTKPIAATTTDSPVTLLGRIVLIEDHEETATLICNLLTTAGYQVVWMIDGSAVMQQVKILQPIAVLLSTRLVGIDAQEILNSLRQMTATQHLPVLILTAEKQPEAHAAWLRQGANDCMTIPIDQPEQLLNKMVTLVQAGKKR